MSSFIRGFRSKGASFSLVKRIYFCLISVLPLQLKYDLNAYLRSPYSKLENENEIIFIHVPKAAGNAVIKTMYGVEATGHDSLKRYCKADSDKYHRFYKFAVVRNPWDRFVSAFFYLKQGGMGTYDLEFSNKYLSEVSDIISFMDKIISDPVYRARVINWIHFRPQIYFLSLDGKVLDVNEVIKVENIDEGVKKVAADLNVEVSSVSKVNSSQRNDYRDYFKESRHYELIKDIYKEDIEVLGYEF